MRGNGSTRFSAVGMSSWPSPVKRSRLFTIGRAAGFEMQWIFFALPAYSPLMRAFVTAALIATGVLSAQTPARYEFEVASVKPSAPIDQSVKIGVHIDGARVSF